MIRSDLMQRRRRGVRDSMIAGTAAVVCAVALPSLAASASPAGARASLGQSGLVSPAPAHGTPVLATTGTTETVRQLVQCGGTMYAVGSFTEISWHSTTYPRDNIFTFSPTAPFKVMSWAPDVNGEINSITFNGNNCSDAYIGGLFTSVNGTTVSNIAEISTKTGDVVPGFGHHASGGDHSTGEVETLLGVRGHILAGGTFTKINGSTADPYYASLNPATGKDDGFLHLQISGHYQFHHVKNNLTKLYNQQLSHSGKLLLAEGDFTSAGGKGRQQIFMLNLTGSTAKVTGWSSPEFDGSQGEIPGGYPYQCGDSHPFYIHAAAWSPNDKIIYLATTGYKPWNWTGNYPLTSLCDTVSAFPATQKEVLHYWANYTGCNSLYSVAASDSAIYAGGHQRWADDADGCNHAGPGASDSPGLGGFTPGASGGALLLNAQRTAGRYSRSRGHGVDDMLLTRAGLWLASDNFAGYTNCGGVHGYSGICFLPYPSS